MKNAMAWDRTVAELTEDEFAELYETLEEQAEGQRGGQLAGLASFLGLWRPIDGSNLRVGVREDSSFVATESSAAPRVEPGESVSIVMRQLFLPSLPHDRCAAQVTWHASHWFEDGKNSQVAHVTTCDAGRDGTASAVGLPIFDGLKINDGIGLGVSIYVTADQGSRPILDLLGGPAFANGLKLAGKFNPVFAMTAPYIQAALGGLMRASKKNFKLVKWLVGMGVNCAPLPLVYGEYILLDGVVRVGREATQLVWSDLKWDAQRECPTYEGGEFRNPYLMVKVSRSIG